MIKQNEQLQFNSALANYELLYDGGESVVRVFWSSQRTAMQQICSNRVFEGFSLAPVYTM